MKTIEWYVLLIGAILPPMFLYDFGEKINNPVIIGIGLLASSLTVIAFILLSILDQLREQSK